MDSPDTRYAVRADGRSIAFQVFGRGPIDLVFCWGFVSHLDLQWTNADLARFFERLGSFSRVIVYDKVGTGLSDPIDHVPTLEERTHDITVVMDAAGSERAALFGESEAGPTAILFSTMHPELVQALILFGSIVQGRSDRTAPAYGDLDPGVIAEKWSQMDQVLNDWGKGRSMDLLMPTVADIPAFRRAMAMYERASLSPSMARGLIDLYSSIDVTDLLPTVRVPTLVLHRREDWVPVEQGRYVGAAIPSARYVELPGKDHAFFLGDSSSVLDEIHKFLTGAPAPVRADRALATVLFTDIVDSTAQAAALGDAAWRQLLERHHDVTAEVVSDAGGRIVKSTGDGALAVLPGPAQAVRCASSLVRKVQDLGLDLRAGIHTGECEILGDDIGGLAVHVGARIASLADPGQVVVSSTVKELVIGSGLEFEDNGWHELKGVPDRWHLYCVAGQGARPTVDAPTTHMKVADRMAVAMARRAPGAMRTLGRLAARRSG